MMRSLKATFINILLLGSFLSLFSCLPEAQEVRDLSDQNSGLEDSTTNVSDSEDIIAPTLDETVNFFQMNSSKFLGTISLFADYSDSFLIRGNAIIDFLKEQTTLQANYCLILNFPTSSGVSSKNVSLLSARVRSYYNATLQTKEYFLQVEPNNETINQGDCLTASMINKINTLHSTTSIAFSLETVCPECNTNIVSQSLRFFTNAADEVAQVSLSNLFISLVPKLGSSNDSPNSCQINAQCSSLGFNCCLSGQCVNHGEVRSEVDQESNKYKIAVQQILANPALIKNYPDVFYICPEMVPTDAENNPGTDIDPIQQANDLFTELNDLYNCTTPTIDEFSICVKEYSDASTLMSSAPYAFTAEIDDITFKDLNANFTYNNITQIDYAGVNFFKEKLFSTDDELALNPSYGALGLTNDVLSSGQAATVQIPLPGNPINDILKVYYRVDGTCEELGTSLARCKKTYKQGQSSTPTRSSDHLSGDHTFKIPSYANTGFNVIVEVGGSTITSGTDTWSLSGTSVQFNSAEFPIFNNQEVSITYFVTDNVANLTKSKSAAQAKINEHCVCDEDKDPCTLKPESTQVNGVSKVTGFTCIYPDPDVPTPPLQKTVYVSAKTVPHKFYDSFGVHYESGSIPAESEQEGTKFEYTDGNLLKPNNQSSYIGFNEIYGSFEKTQASAMPATVVDIEKGKNYDLYVDSGSFSTCLNCGTDYYSNLQKVFPNNFQYMGGGYLPDLVESRRRSNQGDYGADDFRFGRACFVPATMIPWTHQANSDVTTQRTERQAAQHFLFANGYNKDWYGFDYGSLIGSFDGIKWFSIGNSRRIEAESNKLFIALNAYFGDLTINNTFKVTINEMSAALNAGSDVTHDLASDGAQCQKAHICSKDEDCITQLGYDYTCQSVNALNTPWPSFDSNGNEISGSSVLSLLSLVGGSNGEVKRCVYRGRGSLCEKNAHTVTSSTSYTNSENVALHSCSLNTFCEDLNTGVFNNKIARYANSPLNQNIQSFITDKSDLFGLGARILGRPYNFLGTELPPTNVRTQLSALNVHGMCVPGKDVQNSITLRESNYLNSGVRSADSINNIGKTMDSLKDDSYFAFCPATDDGGNYTHFQDVNSSDISHNPYALRNNMSTNSLSLNSFASLSLFNDTQTPVTGIGYKKNSCLRAPGAKCFADFECSPNDYISTKVKTITNFNDEISMAEQDFWKEDLICGNSQDRYMAQTIYPNPLYDTTENKCCRETSKTFTYYSQQHEGSDFKVIDDITKKPLIPGHNQDINSSERYSRTHTIIDLLTNEPSRYPATVVAAPNASSPLTITSDEIKQYNTLHEHNQRMCCTGSWVRSFASGTNGNGGGHKFLPTNAQSIPMSTFKSLSWNPNNIPAINSFPTSLAYDPSALGYKCTPEDYQTADCEIKNISEGSLEETKYLEWFAKFELLGIPQVLIETNETVERSLGLSEIDGVSTDQTDMSGMKKVFPNTIKDIAVNGHDVEFESEKYYSAASYDNFEIGSTSLKKVFSENEFNCCIPTGITVDASTPNEACCTGQMTDQNGPARCCLNDFTDVSVYTNRYVSSEGAELNGQAVSDSNIDAKSGYLKKEIALEMAKNMCCSGAAAFGVAINEYLIPINDNQQIGNAKTRRWLYLESFDNASEANGGAAKYNAGLKWNNHVYCVPSDFEGALTNNPTSN